MEHDLQKPGVWDDMLYHDLLFCKGEAVLPEWLREEARKEMDRQVEMRSFRTLGEIKAVISRDDLDDTACYQKIEEILAVFERLDSTCGFRHLL